MLSLEKVSSGYGKILAIQDVDVEVKKGEIVVLLGADEDGKSTLLRTVSGALHPSRGRILFRGQRIDGKKPHVMVAARISSTRSRKGAGFFPRDPQPSRKNVEMGAYLRSG